MSGKFGQIWATLFVCPKSVANLRTAPSPITAASESAPLPRLAREPALAAEKQLSAIVSASPRLCGGAESQGPTSQRTTVDIRNVQEEHLPHGPARKPPVVPAVELRNGTPVRPFAFKWAQSQHAAGCKCKRRWHVTPWETRPRAAHRDRESRKECGHLLRRAPARGGNTNTCAWLLKPHQGATPAEMPMCNPEPEQASRRTSFGDKESPSTPQEK